MLPQTVEQGGVAERVHQLGAGIKLKKTDRISIQNAINKLLLVGSYKENAMKISCSFKHCSGSKGAADKIEQVCRK